MQPQITNMCSDCVRPDPLTLLLPCAIKWAFANSRDPDETAHNEPSHLDLRCLTLSLSTLYINFFPSDSLLLLLFFGVFFFVVVVFF